MEGTGQELRERQARANRHLMRTALIVALLFVAGVVVMYLTIDLDWPPFVRYGVSYLPVALGCAWVGARERRWQAVERSKKNVQ